MTMKKIIHIVKKQNLTIVCTIILKNGNEIYFKN